MKALWLALAVGAAGCGSGLVVPVADEGGPASYRELILSEGGLVGYWRMDEISGTTAVDETGLNDASIAPSLIYGEVGAIISDPLSTAIGMSTGNFTASVIPAYDFGDASASIEGWVRFSGGCGAPEDLLVIDDNVPAVEFGVQCVPGGVVRVFANDGAAGLVNVSGTTAVNDGVWHHIVGVRKGADLFLYVDGALEGSISGGFSDPFSFAGGSLKAARASTTYDEIAFYADRALSGADVARHYGMALQGP